MIDYMIRDKEQYDILVVDDSPDNLEFLSRILEERGYRVRLTTSGHHGLKSVAARLPDLILLDVKMPEMDGHEICRRLKSNKYSRNVPVIFISAYGDTAKKVEGFKAGGVDYIAKPFEREEVLARVEIHLRLHELTEGLEQQVNQRTQELTHANQQLQQEIAERKRTEETLLEKNYIIESASSFIATCDLDGAMTYINPAFLKKWGFENTSEIYGRPFWEFWMVKDRFDEIMSTLNAEQIWSDEIEARKRDGTLFHVHMLAAMVLNKTGKPVGWMSTSVDITERKQAEEQLEKHRDLLEAQVNERTSELTVAKEKAEAANQSKSEFLARMSHEIRTPLNAVTGLTNIVLKSELTVEQRDYLNKVQIASKNLLEVINDILDFSKIEAGRLELVHDPFDLDHAMEQLADLFSNRVGKKNLELIFTMAPDVPRQLIGDTGRLTQVLTNLVENAVKFTESGEIVVGVKTKDKGPGATGYRQQLIFEVTDTGIGIAADALATLFDPFSQVEGYLTRKHKGSGLGLAICRRLVELMGGQIWVESTSGSGSTFAFTVMLTAQKEQRPRLSLPAEFRGLKTLVVDDSDSSRQVLTDLLESFKFNVTAVNCGEKALTALQQESYQLVLLDWKMPGMDGIEAARRIRRLENYERETGNHKSQTPMIILLTACGQETVREFIDTTTVDTMLLKPIKASQLFNTIIELFGKKEAAVVSQTYKPPTPPFHRLEGRRVLVVEDSELNRDVAVAVLGEAGLAVEVAENGRIAVAKVTKSPKGYYDAVLMDIQMPVMDGYRATKKIREFQQQQVANTEQPETKTPIIALTAHALKGEKEKCLAADMDDYISKPLDEQGLYRVLLKWITPQQGR